MLKGFRDFVLRGNVMDLAVAVIIGAAFADITKSLVGDVISPLIAAIVGKPDFSNFVFHVNGGVVRYGSFVNACINFLILAAVIYFILVVPTQKLLARIKGPEAATTKPCPQCLTDIPLAATRCKACGQPA